jgi:hypothetical protein
VIALVLGVCALAIPATASGAPHIPHGADYSSLTASATPHIPHGADYSSLSATPPPMSEAAIESDSPSDSAGRFDWGDAALGAGAAMVLIALSGAVLFTVRRRPGVSPSA